MAVGGRADGHDRLRDLSPPQRGAARDGPALHPRALIDVAGLLPRG